MPAVWHLSSSLMCLRHQSRLIFLLFFPSSFKDLKTHFKWKGRMLRPFGLSAVTGILLIAEKKRKKCRWINRKLFLDGKEMDGCLKSISGVAASVMVGGLLTRVADDARKIDDPHLMCEKVIHFETCTFVYYIPTLVTYSFFFAGCLRLSGWAPHALCLLAGRQHGRFLFLCALRVAV